VLYLPRFDFLKCAVVPVSVFKLSERLFSDHLRPLNHLGAGSNALGSLQTMV
jgi:hypothetical protein